MKKSSLLIATCLIGGVADKALSMDFNDKVYGKANVNVGYNWNESTDKDKYGEVQGKHSIILSLGFDTYYKLNDMFHPFAGIQVKSSLPVSKFLGKTDVAGNNLFFVINAFSLEGKFGSKINVNKKVSFAPYYLLGYTMSVQSYDDGEGTETKLLNSLSTGFGVDAIFLDRWIVGFEYKWIGVGKLKGDNGAEDQKPSFHQVGIKLGVQFL